MRGLRFIVPMLVALVGVTPLVGQVHEERHTPDAKILFDMNSAEVDESFGKNSSAFEVLDRMLNDESYKIESVEVVSSSSIDGAYSLNKRLSKSRLDAVRGVLEGRYPSIPQSMFKYVSLGENWADLRACVVRDPKVPHKNRVIAVIDNNSQYDRKELELKNIAKGESWAYLKEVIYPQQRYGVGVMFVLKEEYRVPPPVAEQQPVVEKVEQPQPPQQEVEAEEMDSTPPSVEHKALVALKTNLLADVVTALNLEVEVPIGDRYSVAGEFKFPWWRGVKSDFTMQILSGHIEGKYWFGERTRENRLQGFSAGIFTGFGTYDIQPLRTSGTTGDFFELGVMAGYSHSIYKSLNLEYTIGLGYIHSGYRRYDMAEKEGYGYVKQVREEYEDERKYTNTVLPTRLKVSLVWQFGVPKFWK